MNNKHKFLNRNREDQEMYIKESKHEKHRLYILCLSNEKYRTLTFSFVTTNSRSFRFNSIHNIISGSNPKAKTNTIPYSLIHDAVGFIQKYSDLIDTN